MADDLIKYGAAVAAVLLLVSPYFSVAYKKISDFVEGVREAEKKPPSPDDLVMILDLAKRFRDEGNADAVALCQQLIDLMLAPQKSKK